MKTIKAFFALSSLVCILSLSAITTQELLEKLEGKKAELIKKKKNFVSRGRIISPTLSLGGAVDITNAAAQELSLEGSGLLSHCAIEHDAHIQGDAIVTSSSFGGIVHIEGALASFTESTVGGINCKVLGKEQPYVELINTQVKGDITFEGQQGYVIKDKGSTITGKVAGGTVIER